MQAMTKLAMRRIIEAMRRMPPNATPAEALAEFRRLLVQLKLKG